MLKKLAEEVYTIVHGLYDVPHPHILYCTTAVDAYGVGVGVGIGSRLIVTIACE